MTIEEIRANKPDGATHYNQNGDYFCVLHFIFYIWNPHSKNWVTASPSEHNILEPL